MTNAQIIFSTSIDLMNQGIIGTTGRQITVRNASGEESRINEPEPIHTFATWKALGRKIRRGEHAKAKIRIWKFTSKNVNEETDDNTYTVECKNIFMKDAHFFTFDQTEAI